MNNPTLRALLDLEDAVIHQHDCQHHMQHAVLSTALCQDHHSQHRLAEAYILLSNANQTVSTHFQRLQNVILAEARERNPNQTPPPTPPHAE